MIGLEKEVFFPHARGNMFLKLLILVVFGIGSVSVADNSVHVREAVAGTLADIGASADDGVSGEVPNIRAFYIDPNGDDSADGLTPQTAWKTLDNLANKYFSAGEGVLFKRGGYWNGTSTVPFQGARQGTADNPVVFSAYGTGPRPVIDFTVTQEPPWAAAGAGVYTTPLDLVYRLRRLYVDGEEVLDATSYAELVSHEKYKYWHDKDNDLLYIHFDPAGKNIKYSTTYSLLSFGGGSKHITVSDLDIRGGIFSLRFPQTENVIIKNNNLGEGSLIGISITGKNHFIYNNVIDSVRPKYDYGDSGSTAHGPHEAIAIKGNNDYMTIAHNTMRNWAHSSVTDSGRPGTNPNFQFFNNYTDGSNLSYGTKLAVSDLDGAEIWKNYFYKTTRQQISGSNLHIHHNIFDSMVNTPIKSYNTGQAMAIVDFGGDSSDVIIENNVFINSDGPAVLYSTRGSYMGSQVIRNNIMYNNGRHPVTYPGDPLGIAVQIKTGSLQDSKIYSNLVYSDLTDKVFMTGDERSGPTYTVAEFDGANLPDNNDGFDNLQADPLFENVDALQLQLDLSSPAIGAGVQPLATRDWDGYEIIAPYDIGIYNTASRPVNLIFVDGFE